MRPQRASEPRVVEARIEATRVRATDRDRRQTGDHVTDRCCPVARVPCCPARGHDRGWLRSTREKL